MKADLTEYEDLSPNAKAMASLFGTMLKELTFHCVEGVPSPEAQAGLDELVERGLITVEPYNKYRGFVYKPALNVRVLGKQAMKDAMDDRLPRFPITVPVEKDNADV